MKAKKTCELSDTERIVKWETVITNFYESLGPE